MSSASKIAFASAENMDAWLGNLFTNTVPTVTADAAILINAPVYYHYYMT